MNDDLLSKLPDHLLYPIIEDITAKNNVQSALARKQLDVKNILEKYTEQGRRTDLANAVTCPQKDVQVTRRASTTEKVAALFDESGSAVRQRIYVYENAHDDPVKYGKYLKKMDNDNSPYRAYAELKAAQEAEIFDNEVISTTSSSWVQRGDLWVLGHHRLLCGDSTSTADVAHLLSGAVPHLMITDPPYGVEYQPSWRAKIGNKNPKKRGVVANDHRHDWSAALALFPGDVCYIWFSGLHAAEVQIYLEKYKFLPRMLITWGKTRPVISRGHYNWQTESCLYAVREGKRARWEGRKSQANLWMIDNRDDRGHGHGTQKPVECMLRPIRNNSKPNDAVYDPFVGSGTTIVAAETSGRRCYAIEIDPSYCAVSIERWQNLTGQQAILEINGRSFADVMRERAAANAHDGAVAEGTE